MAKIKHEVRPDGSLLITAEHEGHVYEHTVTVGASDAPLPAEYQLEQMRADLEGAKDFAGKMAESKARRHAMLQSL